MSVAPATRPGEPTGFGAITEPVSTAFVAPEDMLYEVVGGEIKEKTVGVQASVIASLLHGFLFMFLSEHRVGRSLAETLFLIDKSKDMQRRPDVAFVSTARWPMERRAPDTAAWDLVPDLAIEIVSPTNTAEGVQAKIHEYFDAGVSRAWVIYPKQKSIHVYTSRTDIRGLRLGDELDGGDLIPGFRLPLAALFQDGPE
jgi:Uma2 family endonuclease